MSQEQIRVLKAKADELKIPFDKYLNTLQTREDLASEVGDVLKNAALGGNELNGATLGAQALADSISLRGLLGLITGVAKGFTGENKRAIEAQISRIVILAQRINEIEIILTSNKLCLDTTALKEEIGRLTRFVRTGEGLQTLSPERFEQTIVNMVSNLLFFFSVFISDFTIMIYALNDIENPRSAEIIRNMQEACGKKKRSPKPSPQKQSSRSPGGGRMTPGGRYQSVGKNYYKNRNVRGRPFYQSPKGTRYDEYSVIKSAGGRIYPRDPSKRI